LISFLDVLDGIARDLRHMLVLQYVLDFASAPGRLDHPQAPQEAKVLRYGGLRRADGRHEVVHTTRAIGQREEDRESGRMPDRSQQLRRMLQNDR